MTSNARVFIVDNHPVVREGLEAHLAGEPDLELCGGCGDAETALAEIARLRPNVVIAEVQLRESSGVELIRQLRTRDDDVRILVWSIHDESVYAERVLRAGALGFINKREEMQTVVEALRRVLQGEMFVSGQLATNMLQRAVRDQNAPPRQGVELLSDRELEVFQQIGSGRATSKIASALGVSVKTIETHRQRIRHKLELADGTELVRFAVHWRLDNG